MFTLDRTLFQKFSLCGPGPLLKRWSAQSLPFFKPSVIFVFLFFSFPSFFSSSSRSPSLSPFLPSFPLLIYFIWEIYYFSHLTFFLFVCIQPYKTIFILVNLTSQSSAMSRCTLGHVKIPTGFGGLNHHLHNVGIIMTHFTSPICFLPFPPTWITFHHLHYLC